MRTMASRLNDHFKASEEVPLEDEDEEKDATSDEASCFGHVINMYPCHNASQKKTTIEKEPPKQKD